MSNYRIKFIPAFCVIDAEYSEEFETHEQAKAALYTIAEYTLLLHEKLLMLDYTNYGIIEKLTDGEWVEIEDEE